MEEEAISLLLPRSWANKLPPSDLGSQEIWSPRKQAFVIKSWNCIFLGGILKQVDRLQSFNTKYDEPTLDIVTSDSQRLAYASMLRNSGVQYFLSPFEGYTQLLRALNRSPRPSS